MSASDIEFARYIVDQLDTLGPIRSKRMFGGHGIFFDGLMFALIADGVLYLKADEVSAPRFEDHNLNRFTYYKKDKPFHLSYYQLPEEALDDHDILLDWSRAAIDAALRQAKH